MPRAKIWVTLALCAATAAPATAQKPDLVLIVTDDLDARTARLMPRVQSLVAGQGVSFERAYVTNPLCAPSRASILTGQYAHNHGVLTNQTASGGFAKFRRSEPVALPTWLRAAGYHTVLLGKYLNGYPSSREPGHVAPGWSEWFALFGGYHFYKYFVNHDGDVLHYGRAAADYETDVLAARLEGVIRGAGTEPLFLYLAPSAPHHPARPARRHESALPDAKAPRPPSWLEPDVSDKPAWVRGEPASPEAGGRIDQIERRRRQSLLAVDELLDALFLALQKTGRLPNTYVVFTSDNGFQLGEHRQVGKGTPYEEAIRVPLYVRGPGVPVARTRDEAVLNIDLAPTLAGLAGAKPAIAVDGVSFARLLGADPGSGAWRRDFLVEHWSEDPGDIPSFTALRSGSLCYVEYATGEREYYDLAQDPYQLQNRSATTPLATLKPLADRLGRLRTCKAESCRE